MRKLKPWRALLASVLGLGLGYLYVGRLRLAFAVPLAILVLGATFGWTRVIMKPWAVYALATGLFVVVGGALIHSMILARTEAEAPSTLWNRWPVYLVWIAGSHLFAVALVESRAALFGFEPFRVPSVSMSPTIDPGDFVMANTWRYRSTLPSYDDLVVLRPSSGSDVVYVRRVVGAPGDEIELRDQKLYRNGRPVEEPYLQGTEFRRPFSKDFGPITVDETSIFVLGDNRDDARDSRIFGPIAAELLLGRVEYRWLAYRDGLVWGRFPQRLNDGA